MRLRPRSCPLCTCRRGRILLRDRNRREGLDVHGAYLRCSHCGMIYLTPIPDFEGMAPEDFDQVYSVADRRRERLPAAARVWLGGLRRAFLPFDQTAVCHSLPRWQGHLPDGRKRRILDIGCTDGAKLRPFQRRGWEIHGADLVPAALDIARRSLPEGYFHLGSIDAIGLPPTYFDVVRADAVLEHVEHPVLFLENAWRLLRPGGLLLLYVPNGESLSMRVLKRGSISSWIPFHLNLFSAATIGRCLHRAGFSNIAIRHNTPAPWPVLSLRQTLAVLRGRHRISIRLSVWGHTLGFLLSPAAAALNLIHLGEELVVSGSRPAPLRR